MKAGTHSDVGFENFKPTLEANGGSGEVSNYIPGIYTL